MVVVGYTGVGHYPSIPNAWRSRHETASLYWRGRALQILRGGGGGRGGQEGPSRPVRDDDPRPGRGAGKDSSAAVCGDRGRAARRLVVAEPAPPRGGDGDLRAAAQSLDCPGWG